MTALLSKMSIFCVRAGRKIGLAGYGSMHTSQCLSDKQFCCTYTHNLKTINKSYVNILHIEQPLYYRRHSLCTLELHERPKWRAMAPDTHQMLPNTTLCAYTASPYFIAISCPTTHDNKTNVPDDCILHTKQWLYCQQRIAMLTIATLHIAEFFQLIHMLIFKLLIP